MAYDLIIRDGTVVDGSGRPRFAADVGLEGDRIVAVGTLGSDARRTIDAAGRVAALIPHAAVRYGVLGAESRAPSPQELAKMRALVREGMEAGAVALSTGRF